MNPQMAIAIPKAANLVPFNDQVNGHNEQFSDSNMSVDSHISTPGFNSGSNMSSPSTFVSTGSTQSSPLINCTKVGLGIIASLNDEAAYETALGLWKTKSILFRHDVKFHVPNDAANDLVKPIIFSVDFVVTLTEIESNGVSPNLQVSDTVYGPMEDPSIRRIVRFIWPCILASPNIKVAMARGGLGYAPSSNPLAICTKHDNAGVLKLEEIVQTEEYTCIIHHHPEPKVVHMYNQCVLIFPPNELIYFHQKNDQLSPPLKLNNNVGSNTPNFKDKFLKNCMTCDKSLEGEDIYIFRGDPSFCSGECRDIEIEADKQKELMKATQKSYAKTAITDKRVFCNLGSEPIGA